MLNSTEHEISSAHDTQNNANNSEKNRHLAFKFSDVIFIMLINDKMPTIVMSMINFMLS